MGVCYRLPDQEAEDEAFFRQLEKPPVCKPWSSQKTLIPVVSAGGTAQSGNNFLTEVIKELRREDNLMALIPINTEELVRDVKDEGSLGWRAWPGGVQNPERREQSKEQDHKAGLKRADFGFLLRSAWKSPMGCSPGEEKCAGNMIHFQGSAPPVYPDRQGIK